jgi:putative salt-induced outer membrane protein
VKLNKYHLIAALSGLLIVTGIASAEEEEGFSGRVGLGYIATSGNSDSKSANGSFDLLWNYEPWRHSLSGTAIQSSTSGVTTAESFGLTAQSKYDFSDKSYFFGLVAFNSDEFSTIDQQTRAVVGYGRHIIDTDKHVLNLEIGAGQRWADLRDGTSEDEVIYRLGGNYLWNISETSKFTQTLSIESGSSNTYTEAVSALNANILDTLALVLSFTVKNNSDVLPGIDKTDTATAISLEYTF